MVVAFIAGAAFWRFGYMPFQKAEVSSVLSPSATELIIGTWTSVDDASYQMTFAPNGALTELYAAENIATGTYTFAPSPIGYVEEDFSATDEAANYLLEDIDGERYAYRIQVVSPERLELVYLERGNTLSFTRD